LIIFLKNLLLSSKKFLQQKLSPFGFICICFFSCSSLYSESDITQKSKPVADLVAFSFDRPMQLYALLESIDFYVTGLGEVTVIYRASNDEFEEAYQEVVETFPGVIFLKQGARPHEDFKPLTLWAAFDSPHDYILFAVDDIIIKDFIDVQKSIEQLEKYGAYGVYFRLGLHLEKNYTRNRLMFVPRYKKLEGDLCSWSFCDGKCDWGYPNTVDMTLYRKKDVESFFRGLNYKAPNTLEGSWSCTVGWVMKKIGLFYVLSKIVNLPINKVQTENSNRTMNAYTSLELLKIFNDGFKIDIAPLYRMKNKSPHEEYVPTFVKR